MVVSRSSPSRVLATAPALTLSCSERSWIAASTQGTGTCSQRPASPPVVGSVAPVTSPDSPPLDPSSPAGALSQPASKRAKMLHKVPELCMSSIENNFHCHLSSAPGRV